MGRFCTTALGIGLCVCLFLGGTAAHAWELDLHAHMLWHYEWYGQSGSRGFFGPYNVDKGGGTLAGNFNFWNGGQFDTNTSTSAKAGWSFFEVEWEPTFYITPAIRINAKYRIASYGEPVSEDYLTQNSPGINTAMSEGQWTLFWVTIQTPWGQFVLGKRPWAFGIGLQYEGLDLGNASSTTESMLISAPFGPLDIGLAYYPFRFAGKSSNDLITAELGDPYNLPRYVRTSGAVVPGQYYSRADGGGTFSKDFAAFVQYMNGPLHMGILGTYGSYHIGPEALINDPNDPLVARLVPQDTEIFHGTAFAKYNNGAFFFNGEAAWVYWTDRWHADPNQVIGFPNPRYIEQWRYAMEWGWLLGPAKFSLLQVWTPGPDRRNGTLIGKQPAVFVRHPDYDRRLGNHVLFKPYSWLLARDYGSGLKAYTLSGWGYMRDAFILAARLDYAVAANLNVFLSFMRADRTSNGYSWGCIGPNAGLGAFPGTPDGNIDLNLNRYPASPNIPDGSLGSEIMMGIDWELLQKWIFTVTVAYWQPGAWFTYACVDRSVPGWETGTAANLYGTRPMRTIDPVIGGEFMLRFDF
jgi:hypothetical protein